jgi:hypothetical protein
MAKQKRTDTTRRHLLTIAAGGAVAATIPAGARAYSGHAADRSLPRSRSTGRPPPFGTPRSAFARASPKGPSP